MVGRVQIGKRASSYGIWVSKPGIDISAAQPGQFIYDSSSVAYQKVLSGLTLVHAGNDPLNTTITKTVSLPSEYASYSDLVVWANLIFTDSIGRTQDGLFPNYDRGTNPVLKMKVTSGVLTLACSINGSDFDSNFYAHWAIFNARIDGT